MGGIYKLMMSDMEIIPRDVAEKMKAEAYQDAYREVMNRPIGTSVTQRESLATFEKKPYAYGDSVERVGTFGKFPNFRKTKVRRGFLEEAWNMGWQKGVEDQNRRLKAFNAFDGPYQGRK